DRALRDLRRLERPRREGGLVGQAAARKPRLDLTPLPSRLPCPGRRVDDEENRRPGPGAYDVRPSARGLMIPSGSSPALTACQTLIQPPISSATQCALAWPAPW